MFLIKKKLAFNGSNRYLFLLAGFFVVALAGFLGVGLAQAAFTPQINYQGKLNDSLGAAVADGNYNMRFRLCQDSACASAIYDETFTDTNKVAVADGLFSVMIGSVSSTLGNVNFNQDTYLEVRVGSTTTPAAWETLTPRKRLGAVPNAFNAEKLDGLATTSFLRADIANARATITNLTSTNFYAQYASTVNSTSTNFFANLLNSLTAIISDLTATIANIATLTFNIATGNDLTATNLTATSTANLKTLYASSTTIVGDLSVTGNSTTTGIWAVVNPATSTSYLSVRFADNVIASNTPILYSNHTYDSKPVRGLTTEGSFSIIDYPGNASSIPGLARGALIHFVDSSYNSVGGLIASSTLDRLEFSGFTAGGVLFDDKVNFDDDVFLNSGLAMGTTTDPSAGLILYEVTNGFKPVQFNSYVTEGNQTLLNAFTYQMSDSAYSDSPIQASLFANYSSSTITNTLSSAIIANLIVGNGSGEDAASLYAKISSNAGESAPSNIYGLYSENLAKASSTYGARLTAGGVGSDINYGLYVDASAGTTNWAGYFNNGNVYMGGNLGIGTTSASLLGAYQMTVDGTSFFNGQLTVGTDSATASSSLSIYDWDLGGGNHAPLIQFNSPNFASNLYGQHAGVMSDKLIIYNPNNTSAEIILANGLVTASTTYIKLATTTNTLGFTGAVEYTFDNQVTVSSGLKLVGGSSLALPGTPASGSSGVFVRGDYAYMVFENATDTKAFRIIDISDPANPVVVGGDSLSLPVYARTITVAGNYAYIGFNGNGQPSTDRFRIVDISSSTNPVVVGGSSVSITAADNVRDVKIVGNYAYLALYGTDNIGIGIVDISNKTNPVLLSQNLNTQTKGHARGIDVRNGHAYLTLYGTSTAGVQDVLRIVDVHDPSNPVLVDPANYNDQSIFWWGRNIEISGNYMYLAGGGWGTDPTNPNATDTLFQIFDISSSTNPVYVGGRDLHWLSNGSGPCAAMDVAVSGNMAYVTGGCDSSQQFRYVSAVDITDKTDPQIVTGVTGGNAWPVFTSGRYVYVGYTNNPTDGTEGLKIYTLNGFVGGSSDFSGYVDVGQGLTVQDTAYFSESVVIGTTTESTYALMVAGTSSLWDLIPETNLTYNLGSSANRWSNLWTQTANIGNATWSLGATVDGSLAIYDAPEQAGNIRLFVATSTGYVGIGTSTPTAKLSVDGSVNLQGAAFATTTIGNYSNYLTFAEKYLAIDGYGVVSMPVIYSNSALSSSAGVNTIFDNNASILGRDNSDPTMKLISSNYETVEFKYTSSSNTLSVGLGGLANGQDMLTILGSRTTINNPGDAPANATLEVNAVNDIGLALKIDGDTHASGTFGFYAGSTEEWKMYNSLTDYGLYVVNSSTVGVFLAPGATSWAAASDIQLKENITPIENALEKVLKLTGYTYNLIGNSKTEVGLIAQEVLPEFPDIVQKSGQYLALNYDRIGPILIQAIKEQQAQIDSLKVSSTTLAVDSEPDGMSSVSNLPVSSAATFYGTITVKGEANFESKVVFKDHVYFDKDMAGVAKVLAGATSTIVVFSKPYETAPIINVTPRANSSGHNWWVEQESTSSFAIAVDPVFNVDFEFNWQAIAVKVDDNKTPVENVVVDDLNTEVEDRSENISVISSDSVLPAVDNSSEPIISVDSGSNDNLDNSSSSDNMPVESNSGDTSGAMSSPVVSPVTETPSVTETPPTESPVIETPPVSEVSVITETPTVEAPVVEAPPAPSE